VKCSAEIAIQIIPTLVYIISKISRNCDSNNTTVIIITIVGSRGYFI